MIRKLLPILGITFIDIVGFSMLIPILPYFVTHFGMSAFVVGILASTFSLCQLISGPIWGNISDRIGRKAVLIISQIGATIGWAMLAFAPNILWVFIARIIEGVSGGNIGITQAYVADVIEPKERSRAFGLIGATFGAGMIFGPAGGGLLFAKWGFAAPFLAASALQFLTLLLTIFLLPETRGVHEDEAVGLEQIAATFRSPRLRPILLQKTALALSLYAWYLVIALFLKGQLGFSLTDTTWYFSGFAIFGVLVNVVGIGQVSKRTGDARMANIAFGFLIACFALVPFVHTTLEMIGVMMLFGIGQALGNSGVTAQMSNAVTAREQGTVLSVSSSLDAFAGICAPPISTGLLARYGSPFAGAASLVFASLALFFGLTRGKPSKPADTLVIEETAEA
jgi:multidrug resistance protein